MKTLTLAYLAAAVSVAAVGQALAHGDHPHPTCKPGYVLNDAHKCVKKS